MKRMDVRQLDLNLLRVFAQLLRERQVSRAAVALGLSQPAVSNALRRLREELGDELFHRSARGMQPTAYALRIAPAVTQALDLIGGALATAQDFDPVNSQRSFTLAMSDVGQIYFLPLLMETLACEAPQVSLRIVGLNAAELPLAMSDGRIDVALGWLPQLQAGFFQQVLFRQGYVCLMRAGHPAAARPWGRASFRAREHVHVEASGSGHGSIEAQLQRLGLQRRIHLTVPDYVALGHVLLHTDLVATVPERFAERICATLALERRPLPVRLPDSVIHQVWHGRAHRDPAHCWLRQVLHDGFASGTGQASARGTPPPTASG